MLKLYEYIADKFAVGEWSGYGKKTIFSELDTKSTFERRAVEDVLKTLEKNGVIVNVNGRYQRLEECGYVKGVIRGNERGFAFVTDANGNDYFIPHKRLNGACNKDEVLIGKVESDRGSNDEAEVVKILSRGVTTFGGTYYNERRFGFVRSDDKNYYTDVKIPFALNGGAKNGDKVVVDVVAFPDNSNPEGRVVEIVGKSGDLHAEEKSLIRSFGYVDDFPETVKSEVKGIPQNVGDKAIIGRKDFTDRFIITIDGEDSRDFDDAVEVELLENGRYLLGVHIADVSEYVKTGSAIDKEAFERATSVYFPDGVIPMLPKELSDGICSLVEGEKRLTLSCIMEITADGEVVGREIVKSVIKSAKRMTYTAVQAILDGDKDARERYKEVVPSIERMRALQLALTKRRNERGSINLDVRDSHITIKNGTVDVEPQKDLDAYKIIEEFMVLCNEEIAEYLYYLELPCVYRVHERPSTEKANDFISFLSACGISVKWKADDCRPSDFAALLNRVEGEPVYPIINKVMLRSMQKAKYSGSNLGHFGISSKCYCHFTSPIRRYPDLTVHRIVKASLDGDMSVTEEKYFGCVDEVATQSSVKERKADEAERAVDDLYKAVYAYAHRGEEFDGVISGVTSAGVFTELENGVEGFTRVEDLPRGKYVYDEKTYSLRSGKYSYSLGERVRVGVLGANLTTRRVDFIILTKKDKKRCAKS